MSIAPTIPLPGRRPISWRVIHGPVLAMFRRDRRGQGAEDAFRAFGFAIDDASCATVESRVRPPEPTFLCRLRPVSAG